MNAKTYSELIVRKDKISKACDTCHDINGKDFCDSNCPFFKAQFDLAKKWDEHSIYKLDSLIEHICAQHYECNDCLFYSDCLCANDHADSLEPAFEAIRKLIIR